MKQAIKHRVSSLSNDTHKDYKYYKPAEKFAIKNFGTNFTIRTWYN